jgi:hypothetical protein
MAEGTGLRIYSILTLQLIITLDPLSFLGFGQCYNSRAYGDP